MEKFRPEKFYYLELLRRAGWLDSVPDESFIGLRVPEEKSRSAEGFFAFLACAQVPCASPLGLALLTGRKVLAAIAIC